MPRSRCNIQDLHYAVISLNNKTASKFIKCYLIINNCGLTWLNMVRQALALLHGEKYVLSLNSRLGSFCMELHVPFMHA